MTRRLQSKVRFTSSFDTTTMTVRQMAHHSEEENHTHWDICSIMVRTVIFVTVVDAILFL